MINTKQHLACNLLYIHKTTSSLPFTCKSLMESINTQEALVVLKKQPVDIIIVELELDSSALISLIDAIYAICSKVSIIIISQLNSFELVQYLLNHNVYRFLSPPADAHYLIQSIQELLDKKALHEAIDTYRIELEMRLKESTLRNELLEKTVSVLDAKVARFGNIESNTNKIEHISQKDILELGELEIDIEGIISVLSITNTFDTKSQTLLESLFNEYANILSNYNSYSDISQHLLQLASSFQLYTTEIEIFDIIELLESFVYVLKNWSLSFALNDFKNTQSYHASIINDITTIVAILKGENDAFESDIEFF